MAWDLCGDKQDKLSLFGVPRGEGESCPEPLMWKCITVLLQRVLGVLPCGALTGGEEHSHQGEHPEHSGCTERLNRGLCVYIYLFIFKLKM